MAQMRRVSLPLPEPLRGADAGSFANYSVRVRLAEIANRMIEENEFPASVLPNLNRLVDEISGGVIRQLLDRTAPDHVAWQSDITPYQQQTWLNVPWFFAETYFYRRILEATGYFQDGKWRGRDPFSHQKLLGLESSREAIHGLAAKMARWVEAGWNDDRFIQLLEIDLWGNQADLSLWPVGNEGDPSHRDSVAQRSHLLIDDSRKVLGKLNEGGPPPRVDFLIDNGGFELVCDLCLADFLLSCERCDAVHFNLKNHPTFVSDAMISDVEQTVLFLAADSDAATRELAGRLRSHLHDKRLMLDEHPFWTTPHEAWNMPTDLASRLASSRLTLSKGDANYRRLLGDRRWPYTTPFSRILSYFPSPIAALRTSKSEVGTGLSTQQLERLNREDPTWMTNGKWGIIQYAEGA